MQNFEIFNHFFDYKNEIFEELINIHIELKIIFIINIK